MNYSISWFDLLVVAVLMFGIWRGRRRGMSEELLDLLKWIAIVPVAGMVTLPLGKLLAEASPFSRLACNIAVYVTIALLVAGLFAMIRSAVGSKLVGSDAFGPGEYYLGMMSGAVRYACILIFSMSLVQARLYSQEEIAADERFQNDNYGDIRFPTLASLQTEVFKHSWSGRTTKNLLAKVLIRPARTEDKQLSDSSMIAHARDPIPYDLKR